MKRRWIKPVNLSIEFRIRNTSVKGREVICMFLFLLRLWHSDDYCTPILTILPFMSVLFTHQCKYNATWCDCHASERFIAIKPVRSTMFYIEERTKTGIWRLLSIRLMCFIIWFCHSIRNFSFWIFREVQYFGGFIFYYHRRKETQRVRLLIFLHIW